MNGIALIIPGADYSRTSLGKVTFVKSSSEQAEEIVTAYETVIGTSIYHDALFNFVKGCIDNGVWDGMYGFYPMIGDTLQKLSLNLKNDGIPISLLENASAGTNYIHFTNTIAVTTPTSCKDPSLYDEETGSYNYGTYKEKFIFARVKPVKNVVNSNPLFYMGNSFYNNGLSVYEKENSLRFGFYYSSNGTTYDTSAVDSTSFTSYMGKMFGKGNPDLFTAKLYKNGVYISERTSGTGYASAEKLNALNQLGMLSTSIISSPYSNPGTTITPDGKLFNGDVNMFAFGNLPDNKVSEFNQLVNTLTEDLGK